MVSRTVLIALALFWMTMTVLLWRAEWGSGKAGSALPVGGVWEKILTAPDSSSLSILHHGEKIGYCHWLTSVGEEWGDVTDANLPSGLPRHERGYQLRLEGNALIRGRTNRIRFESSLQLNPRRDWQEMKVRMIMKPVEVQVIARATNETVQMKLESPDFQFDRFFKFSELQNPMALVSEFAGPVAGGVIDQMTAGLPESSRKAGLGLKWDAREDMLRIGRSEMRVYRLQTRLLDRYQATLFVSRVGEILRVELPDGLVLVNDSLFILP